MTPIVILYDGQPQGKERPRLGKNGNVYTPPSTVRIEQAIGYKANRAMAGRPLLEGPIEIIIHAFMDDPMHTPDWDNIGKLCADALNKIVYRDDRQIVSAIVKKLAADKPNLRIEVRGI